MMFAEAVRRTHNGESVSYLFPNVPYKGKQKQKSPNRKLKKKINVGIKQISGSNPFDKRPGPKPAPVI